MAVFACCKNAKFLFHFLPDGQHRFQQKFSLSIEISFKVVALGVGLHVADEVLERGQAHRPQVDGHHGPDARKEPLDLEWESLSILGYDGYGFEVNDSQLLTQPCLEHFREMVP